MAQVAFPTMQMPPCSIHDDNDGNNNSNNNIEKSRITRMTGRVILALPVVELVMPVPQKIPEENNLQLNQGPPLPRSKP